jgi:HJR/Mrr/RecB family endonuclease
LFLKCVVGDIKKYKNETIRLSVYIITLITKRMWILLKTSMKTYTESESDLAYELASTLEDMSSLQLYLQFAQKYKEEHLRETLEKVMSLDGSKIKKTRGALFTYLVKGYGRQLHTRN